MFSIVGDWEGFTKFKQPGKIQKNDTWTHQRHYCKLAKKKIPSLPLWAADMQLRKKRKGRRDRQPLLLFFIFFLSWGMLREDEEIGSQAWETSMEAEKFWGMGRKKEKRQLSDEKRIVMGMRGRRINCQENLKIELKFVG